MIPTGRHLWTPRLWIEVREAWRLVWAVLAYVHVSLTGDHRWRTAYRIGQDQNVLTYRLVTCKICFP